MGDTSQHPRRVAAKAQEPEIGDRRGAADGREVTEVAVAERLVKAPAREAGANELRDVPALLLGDRAMPGSRRPALPLTFTVSPMTKTLGSPATERSAPTLTRPSASRDRKSVV